MKHLSLIAPVLLLGCFASIRLCGCKENPVAPIKSPILPYGSFHGTWHYIGNRSNLIRLSFDSTSFKFVDEWDYGLGLKREFTGSFALSTSKVELFYDYGTTRPLWYRLSKDTLALWDDSLLIAIPSHYRMSSSPAAGGWSKKVPPLKQRTYFPSGFIMSFAFSDSGPIALVSFPPRYLARLDSMQGVIILEPAGAVRAIDAVGSSLWLATDSLIQRRSLGDSTIVASFSFRSSLPAQFHVTGLAVGTDRCFLLSVSNPGYHQGMLSTYSLSGALIDTVRTSPSLQDLCLANGRLFCTAYNETFYELSTITGMAISYYNLLGSSFGNNVLGIGFNAGEIQLLDFYASHWRLSAAAVPN